MLIRVSPIVPTRVHSLRVIAGYWGELGLGPGSHASPPAGPAPAAPVAPQPPRTRPPRLRFITVINDMTAVWAIPAPCFCNQFLYLVMPLQVVSHGLQQKEHIGAGSQVNVKENLKTAKLNSSFNFLFRIVIRV